MVRIASRPSAGSRGDARYAEPSSTRSRFTSKGCPWNASFRPEISCSQASHLDVGESTHHRRIQELVFVRHGGAETVGKSIEQAQQARVRASSQSLGGRVGEQSPLGIDEQHLEDIGVPGNALDAVKA